MIVFDLRCRADHVFEAWFASTAAFEDQRDRALVSCPLCGDTRVEKALMAPNVAPKGNRSSGGNSRLAELAKAQAAVLAQSQWVGSGFAEQARAMHDGDVPHATIHGQATVAEARALVEDGVSVLPLPLPVVPPKARN